MNNDFKMQVHFDEEGDDIENIIATYISSLLDKKNNLDLLSTNSNYFFKLERRNNA